VTWQPELWTYDGVSANVAEADEAEERNSKPTQAAFILGWLQLGKRVTPMLALQLWGCNRLAARIAELKREGWDIKREMVETATGKRVAEYWL
jgi:hypothetical protein